MLAQIDKALAGAIDVVADDVQNTYKSVKEQGISRTLRDAVEDAAGLVGSGVGSVASGIVGRNQKPKEVSTHSGITGSSYADLCAGPGAQFGSHIGGLTTNSNKQVVGGFNGFKKNNGSTFKPQGAAGGFAPGIGIQRNTPGQFNSAVFAGGAAAPAPYIPSYQGSAGQAPSAANQSVYAAAAASMAANSASAVPRASSTIAAGPTLPKGTPMPQAVSNERFEQIRQKDPLSETCMDCGAPNTEWVSVSFGIYLCISCGGHHRQMGTHISRIRSIKMDSWTDQQLKVFENGGNKRLSDFFAANGVAPSLVRQRYVTPAAEWYREAWVKCSTLGKPVPAPPAGVQVGPCTAAVDESASAKAKAVPAPQADLLDMDEKKAPVAAAKQADLLGFDDAPSAKETDLLGVGGFGGQVTGSSDLNLLGLDSAPSATPANATADADLLAFAAIAQSARPVGALDGLDLGAAPAPAVQATVPSAVASGDFATPMMPASSAAFPTPGATGTLGGGAKLVEQPADKKDDPFAMALNKWAM